MPEEIHICSPEQLEVARSIVHENLGDEFSLENDLPVNVGVKGDNRFVGDTLLIAAGREATKKLIESFDFANRPGLQDDLAGRVSTLITNQTDASKVLLDITSLAQEQD